MTRPHSDRNQGRKLEPKAVRIRIPEMYRDHIRAEIKRLKATPEYKAVVKRINDEEGAYNVLRLCDGRQRRN